jgi:uncharacterized protein (TIGR00730 family)
MMNVYDNGMLYKNICVFCGAQNGVNPQFASWSYALGSAIATNQQTLVFGGGSNGLMGQVARGAIAANGKVIGIIPHQLKSKEGLTAQLTQVHFVETMGERKRLMDEYTNAYVVLPGGVGTLDELFDVWATAQTGFHQKPIIIANWSGYYDGLLSFLEQCIQEGFANQTHMEKITVVTSLEELMQNLSSSH